jgi:predicted transcriptional regulator
MKTITLKTDDLFFEKVSSLAKSLHISKSELIRQSVREYENFIRKQELKDQIKQASLNVRKANEQISKDFDTLINDGLENV